MSAEVHQSAGNLLEHHDGRYTRQRRELVDLLLQAGQPVTVEELRAFAPHLAHSSLYRNLAVLEETGIVRRLTGPSGFARFELAEELTGHHHHLVCKTCGSMTDVQLPRAIEDELDRTLSRLARTYSFAIDAHRLDILGRCQLCSQRADTPRTSRASGARPHNDP
jgi:Fe2+ or Zn2+ uptake regulation protein